MKTGTVAYAFAHTKSSVHDIVDSLGICWSYNISFDTLKLFKCSWEL